MRGGDIIVSLAQKEQKKAKQEDEGKGLWRKERVWGGWNEGFAKEAKRGMKKNQII